VTIAGGHPVTRPHQVTGQGDVYWEDLAAGVDIVGPGVTMTEAHLVSWAGLTGDWVSLHLDAEYAASQSFGQRIAHGPLTMSLALGLLTQTGIFGNVRAWLGVDQVRALKPVLIGDTIHPEATLRETRATRRPQHGIWTLDYRTLNQRDEVVMTFTGSLMLQRREPAAGAAEGSGTP
jgi:itaconyl-CoA hydratase